MTFSEQPPSRSGPDSHCPLGAIPCLSLTPRKAFIQSFVKEIVVMPGDALLRYTVPMSSDSLIPGKAIEKLALNDPVSVHRSPPTYTVDRTVFELWLGGL